MNIERMPTTNSLGLVLPPDAEKLTYLSYVNPKKSGPDNATQHHQYWPRKLYQDSELAMEFRNHRFNSIWILGQDHINWHNEFDGVEIPPTDVMKRFLEEANILHDLGVCVYSVELMDIGLYCGVIRRVDQTKLHRDQRLDTIQNTLKRARDLTVIAEPLSRLVLSKAQQLIEAA